MTINPSATRLALDALGECPDELLVDLVNVLDTSDAAALVAGVECDASVLACFAAEEAADLRYGPGGLESLDLEIRVAQERLEAMQRARRSMARRAQRLDAAALYIGAHIDEQG
jgi:hypothetical protein